MANYTFYAEIPEVGGKTRPKTAIYFPPAYGEGKVLNLLIYLHGTGAKPIDVYLNDARFPLREKVKGSGKNVVFVAPTLTDTQKTSDSGKFEEDPDWYIEKVRSAIKDQEGDVAEVNGIILACHSGGGRTTLQIVKNLVKYKPKLKEVWGFDCLYMPPGHDPSPWDWRNEKTKKATRPPETEVESQWAQNMPLAFVYYWGTVMRSQNLEKLVKDNPSIPITVTRSGADSHDHVPRTHLMDRLNNTKWL